MTELEKVVNGLEACQVEEDGRTTLCEANGCPYNVSSTHCMTNLHKDALAILKAQVPRVMTWREIVHSIEIESPAIWLEDRDKVHVIPALTIASYVTNSENVTFVVRGKRIDAKHSDYCKRWRAWTARPTEEQRKAVKWG